MKMKPFYTSILLMMLVVAPKELCADKYSGYLQNVEFNNRKVIKNGRQVELQMTVDMSNIRLKTQHTVALTPVLVSADGSKEVAFPPLVIDGKTRNKVYRRAQLLESVEMPPYHDANSQAIIRRNNGKKQQYDYAASLPYERWMLGGSVEIREKVHGCANCEQGESREAWNESFLPPYVPQYRLEVVEPLPEPVKRRDVTRSARLQFRQDSYRILPNHKNNRAELDSVKNSLEVVNHDRNLTIVGIYITGYASPEGSVQHNLKLSENRAKAFANYIAHENKINQEMMHVDWKGEDWVGFRQVLQRYPHLLKRDEVYRIVDECQGDFDACEKKLQELIPADIYTRLLNEIYPHLRRNEYRIEYNVRNFNLQEAREMLNECPELLSLEEIYKVAGSYEKGTPEYQNAIETAFKCYPGQVAAVNRTASEAIEAGNFGRAIQILEASKLTTESAALLNTLGVAYANHGDYEKALDAFNRAEAAGATHAQHNRTELKGVTDQL